MNLNKTKIFLYGLAGMGILLLAVFLSVLVHQDQHQEISADNHHADWIANIGNIKSAKVIYESDGSFHEFILDKNTLTIAIEDRDFLDNQNYSVTYTIEKNNGNFIDIELSFSQQIAFIRGLEPGETVTSNFGDNETFISVPTDWTGKTELPIYSDRLIDKHEFCLKFQDQSQICHLYSMKQEEDIS